jgi:hypothetical protein
VSQRGRINLRRSYRIQDPFDERLVQEADLPGFDYNTIGTYNDTQAKYEMAGEIAPYYRRWRRWRQPTT